MRAVGAHIGQSLVAGDLVILNGPLGAGKTTLTQGIAAGLNVEGPITSPTFVIARVHLSLSGGPNLVHVDAYRLQTLAEVDDLDLDVTLSDSVTVVEWGEGKVNQLDDHPVNVTIDRDIEPRQIVVSRTERESVGGSPP